LGGILGGIGKSKDEAANRKFLADQSNTDYQRSLQSLGATMGNANAQSDESRADALGQVGLNAANTTPDRVAWRQNQAVRAAIMPELRNVSIGVPANMQQYVPQISGGLRLPEGGFSQDTLKFFGDNAMLAGESDLDRAGGIASSGRYATPSYGQIYNTQQGTDTQGATQAANANLRAMDAENRKRRDAALQASLIPSNMMPVNKKY
jgi:hypothetical protein